MQHFRVKIFGQTGDGFNLGTAIPVYHRWIQQQAIPEVLIDVADYQHVPDGPGILLVAHEGFYSLASDGALTYTRRTVANGTPSERIGQAFEAAAGAGAKLESEPEFANRLRFDLGRCEVSVNDRMLAPNNDETKKTLEPELRKFFDKTWGAGSYDLTWVGEPRELVTARLTKKSG